jgi:hypothetical protein
LAGAREIVRKRNAAQLQGKVPANKVIHRLGRAAIRNVLHLDAGQSRELGHGDMVLGTNSGCPVAQLPAKPRLLVRSMSV